ncbi:hypothetical protein AB9E06_22135 [Rhizobium leguminosarum]|uniref:hypothetical protein n=1 Tax=Rhizobium leguminosarum TaxID=384 RepID=UPI003F9DFD9E
MIQTDEAGLFAKLVLIRSMRRDNLARQSAVLRHQLAEMEAKAETIGLEITQAINQVDTASPTRLMKLGKLVHGQQLHNSILKAAAANAELERLRQRYRSMEDEILCQRQAADRCAESLRRSVGVVQRTECVLETLHATRKANHSWGSADDIGS